MNETPPFRSEPARARLKFSLAYSYSYITVVCGVLP